MVFECHGRLARPSRLTSRARAGKPPVAPTTIVRLHLVVVRASPVFPTCVEYGLKPALRTKRTSTAITRRAPLPLHPPVLRRPGRAVRAADGGDASVRPRPGG